MAHTIRRSVFAFAAFLLALAASTAPAHADQPTTHVVTAEDAYFDRIQPLRAEFERLKRAMLPLEGNDWFVAARRAAHANENLEDAKLEIASFKTTRFKVYGLTWAGDLGAGYVASLRDDHRNTGGTWHIYRDAAGKLQASRTPPTRASGRSRGTGSTKGTGSSRNTPITDRFTGRWKDHSGHWAGIVRISFSGRSMTGSYGSTGEIRGTLQRDGTLHVAWRASKSSSWSRANAYVFELSADGRKITYSGSGRGALARQ